MTDEERIPTEEENPAAVGEKDDPVRHFSPLEDYPEAIDAQTDDGPEAEKEPPAKQDAVQTDYAAVAREDLRALKAEFPELAAIGSITELNAPLRYAELRDLGASPREAYLATAKRRPPSYDNRGHLHSAVPRPAAAREDGISVSDMQSARELFSGLSDGEIRKLYRRVTAQNQ